jgi:uncharacterized membrane protein (DUF2068 family)
MSATIPVQTVTQSRRRVRYLKIIAIFEIVQGLLLLCVGLSLLILHSRSRWLDAISDWVDGELMLVHSRAVLYLLNRLQDVVAGGLLRVTGFVALFYSALLCTEGVGVYLQRRWGELLLVIATAALIPFEIRHVWVHPGVVAALILVVNCVIVWFVYRVLRRERTEGKAVPPTGEKDVVLQVR